MAENIVNKIIPNAVFVDLQLFLTFIEKRGIKNSWFKQTDRCLLDKQ